MYTFIYIYVYIHICIHIYIIYIPLDVSSQGIDRCEEDDTGGGQDIATSPAWDDDV
jgi:hypothetical protein